MKLWILTFQGSWSIFQKILLVYSWDKHFSPIMSHSLFVFYIVRYWDLFWRLLKHYNYSLFAWTLLTFSHHTVLIIYFSHKILKKIFIINCTIGSINNHFYILVAQTHKYNEYQVSCQQCTILFLTYRTLITSI